MVAMPVGEWAVPEAKRAEVETKRVEMAAEGMVVIDRRPDGWRGRIAFSGGTGGKKGREEGGREG